MPDAQRILIAAGSIADGQTIEKLLHGHFAEIAVSSHSEQSVADFERYSPAVLILGFRTVEHAQDYYLGLYRFSSLAPVSPHRTVLLCAKDEVNRAYDLCRKQYFHDYVLFWPNAYDGLRLPMAIHQALSSIADEHDRTESALSPEIGVPLRRIAGLEQLLETNLDRGGEYIASVGRSIERARHDVDSALERFAGRLAQPGLAVQQAQVREELQSRREEIATQLERVAEAVEPARQWAASFREELAPQLENIRTLQSSAQNLKPLVLVIEDDEFQRTTLRHLLKEANVETVLVASARDGYAVLRKRQPDLVLLDIELPDIDGRQVLASLRAQGSPMAGVPVIITTGHGEKEVVMECIRAGANDFAVKPFNKDIILAKVKKALETKS